ncbi:MAG: hypothetical protein ACFB6R_13865 [Alphaproteobacteria bacterium]
MAKTASNAASSTNRMPTSGGLAGRLLRGLQRTADGSGGLAEASALAKVAETATALQLLRVSVETMAEICADANRACDRAIHAADDTERETPVRRVAERVRDLTAAGAKAVMPGHPSLVEGAWMLRIPLPGDDAMTVRIPGLRSVPALDAVLKDTHGSERSRLDALQTGLSEVRVEIRDTRIAILGILDHLNDSLDPAAM